MQNTHLKRPHMSFDCKALPVLLFRHLGHHFLKLVDSVDICQQDTAICSKCEASECFKQRLTKDQKWSSCKGHCNVCPNVLYSTSHLSQQYLSFPILTILFDLVPPSCSPISISKIPRPVIWSGWHTVSDGSVGGWFSVTVVQLANEFLCWNCLQLVNMKCGLVFSVPPPRNQWRYNEWIQQLHVQFCVSAWIWLYH